jgi:glutathione S-transferase
MEGLKLKLLVHKMCPFAERALLALAFKNIEAEIVEVDLTEKSEELLEVNPKGQVPSLQIVRDGVTYNTAESLFIAEYFDSFPGPSLFPQRDGQRDPVAKLVISLFIETKTSFISGFYKLFFGNHSPESIEALHAALQVYEDALSADKFFLSDKLGTDSATFLDVAVFPHIERLHAFKDTVWSGVDVDKYVNLWRWYDRITSLEWVQRFKVAAHRYVNLQKRISAGDQGLKLPLEYYDEEVN